MNIAVIGGGIAGKEILKSFSTINDVNVSCIVDIIEDAPGIIYAKEMGIRTLQSIDELHNFSGLDIIIEVTGNENIAQKVFEEFHEQCAIIESQAALLFVKLAKSNSIQIDQLNSQVALIDMTTHHVTTSLENIEKSHREMDKTSLELKTFASDTHSSLMNVNKMIQYVDGITKQTKILGINASIEASRAGEQGKTFSVVANEIQKLAISTENQSKEVSSVLMNLSNRIESLDEIVVELEDNSQHQAEIISEMCNKINELNDICKK